MIRPAQTWIVFGLCLAVVLAAMGWISLTTLKLDRAEAEARRQALLEEDVRLALWRMESALGPLIAQETSRPYFAYDSFYAADRAYTRMFSEIRRGDVLVPSPLLTQSSPHILLHFQFDPAGELSSPQVPTGSMREIAEGSYVRPQDIETSAARLAELRTLLDREQVIALLPEEPPRPVAMSRIPFRFRGDRASGGPDEQYIRNDAEWQARADNTLVAQANVNYDPLTRSSDVKQGVMQPAWFGSVLALVRKVSVSGQQYVQGCWLDWTSMREWLLAGVKDLLPAADLKPVSSQPKDEPATGRVLASLPVRLAPGAVPETMAAGMSPVRLSLVIAWGCVLLAAVAVGVLLRGAVSLSERRGSFVSAVTHELRTPLTTLRMYTEMLADGIVSGEEKTRRYLSTLRAEAERLGHLVENVLGYARLEARSPGALARLVGRNTSRRRELAPQGVEATALRDLLDRLKARLAQRAEQAGMELVVDVEDDAASLSVRADASAVEHILFNLVDNACKYAASASNRAIHVEAGRKANQAMVSVRDHGPGVTKRDTPRLFRPFCKSARDAANSKPGVGLGLALSRRLARSMGGDLRLDESITDGAAFVLTLPLDKSPA